MQKRPELLSKLLKRQDVWRGHSYAFTQTPSLSTGLEQLDNHFVDNGWPLGALVEVCAKNLDYNWQIVMPATRKATHQGEAVIVNPPYTPCPQALVQAQINLHHLHIIQPSNVNEFIYAITEFASTPECQLLLAWETQLNLSYTQLRKIQLSVQKSSKLCILFRQEKAHLSHSPASLRLKAQLQEKHVNIEIFKQRGMPKKRQLRLKLPSIWLTHTPHNALYVPQEIQEEKGTQKDYKPRASKQLKPTQVQIFSPPTSLAQARKSKHASEHL